MRHYNEARLHGAISYLTPATKRTGGETTMLAERDRKLETAREGREKARRASLGAG